MVLQKLFGFDPSKHSVKTEIMAGLTSFLTMAYILAVNPNIFSALADQGMDTKAVFTATIIAAVIGTLVMAIYAKLPFGLAPGMGLNAFFVYNVCLQLHYSWQFALTALKMFTPSNLGISFLKIHHKETSLNREKKDVHCGVIFKEEAANNPNFQQL